MVLRRLYKNIGVLFIGIGLTVSQAYAAENNNSNDANTSTSTSTKMSQTTNSSNTSAESIWTSEAALGFIKTTGNTETEAYNFKFELDNETEKWEHGLRMESSRNADSIGTTAERYFLSMKSQYAMQKIAYMFGRLTYEDDRFSGYDYQTSTTLGYGHKVADNSSLVINAEIGAGIRKNNFDDGTSTTESIVLLAGDLDWIISDSASLVQELTFEIGAERTISKSITALKTQINGSLSSRISYTVRNQTVVPIGTEKTDTELTIALVYEFK